MLKKATVIGGGAWGTAIAHVLAGNNYDVLIWALEEEVVQGINEHKRNSCFLDGVDLHGALRATASLSEAFNHSSIIFLAVPVMFMRTIIQQCLYFIQPTHRWVILNKGVEKESLLLPSQIIDDILAYVPPKVVIGGPTFAHELASHYLTAAAIAGVDDCLIHQVKMMLETDYFKLYPMHDVIGLQCAGAFKNVLALAAGIMRGLGGHDNAVAYLLTQGMCQIADFITHMGGNPATMYTLGGIGDIILTCTGSLSKNLRVGSMLGQGLSLDQVAFKVKTLPEGINTVQSLHQMMTRINISYPLIHAVNSFVFKHASRDEFMRAISSF